MRLDPVAGKKARTQFKVLEKFRDWTLLQWTPLTHRQHQVRVHLRYTGCPVAGDQRYGQADCVVHFAENGALKVWSYG